MGREIDRASFTERDARLFRERLERCLQALERLLERPGFGAGPNTLGAELEVSLVDGRGQPLPLNHKIVAETLDPRISYELNRFNVECNLPPDELGGEVFRNLADELDDALSELRRMALQHRGRVAVVGILPTLEVSDLQGDAMTDLARYRVLSDSLRRRRGQPFRVRIDGAEPIHAVCDSVTFEGANTSLQVHLKVPPDRFAAHFNAAQLAAAPVLAAAGNSPLFLGHLLWEETRVPLFKQAVDARHEVGGRRVGPSRVSFGRGWVNAGALELFRELVAIHDPLLPACSEEDPLQALRVGAVPCLDELRLHTGTVWQWNRPVYDPTGNGHVRMELRALPAGPTVIDMVANAAFLVGLVLGLPEAVGTGAPGLRFEAARQNFYRAAQHGLRATVQWPSGDGGKPESRAVAGLLCDLLPIARSGLEGAGIGADEIRHWLGVIEGRVATGQTGAIWQRNALLALEPRFKDRRHTLREMLEEYLERSEDGAPVHTWSLPGSAG